MENVRRISRSEVTKAILTTATVLAMFTGAAFAEDENPKGAGGAAIKQANENIHDPTH